jgi:hypothetical protein
MTRGRVTALAVSVFVVVGALAVLAIRSVPSGCGYSLPPQQLPDALRAQGGFDQAVDRGDTATLDDMAQNAAQAMSPAMLGARAQRAVVVAAESPGHPDAVVIPLAVQVPAGTPAVAGLAVFLTDCSGRLHYQTVDVLGQNRIPAFPAVSQADAQTALGGPVELVYTGSAERPVWIRRGDASRSTPGVPCTSPVAAGTGPGAACT